MKYGEPWRIVFQPDSTGMDDAGYEVYPACGACDEGGWTCSSTMYYPTPLPDDCMARAVACVNACVGIDDPAEALRAAREAMEEMAEYLDQRADADCTDDGHYVPNEEMALHTRVADALRLLKP